MAKYSTQKISLRTSHFKVYHRKSVRNKPRSILLDLPRWRTELLNLMRSQLPFPMFKSKHDKKVQMSIMLRQKIQPNEDNLRKLQRQTNKLLLEQEECWREIPRFLPRRKDILWRVFVKSLIHRKKVRYYWYKSASLIKVELRLNTEIRIRMMNSDSFNFLLFITIYLVVWKLSWLCMSLNLAYNSKRSKGTIAPRVAL